MKRKSFIISLVVILSVILITPLPVLAARPVEFNASGTIDAITTGTVLPAGNSGRWVVQERELCGSIFGDINGDFTLNYKANVNENQAGTISGKLIVGQGSYILSLNGKSLPLELVWFEPFQTYLPKISINGLWTFIDGAHGTGNYEAWFVFIPQIDEQGNVHVGQIIYSAIELSGKWQT